MPINEFNINLDNIRVTLPDDLVIIPKIDFQEMEKHLEKGRYYSMKDVLNLLNVSRPWLLDNVLLNPRWRKEIDIEQNKTGFVKYPKNQGGKYLFLASRTRQFFEEHFSEILKET